MRITAVVSPSAGQVREVVLHLPCGATLQQARDAVLAQLQAETGQQDMGHDWHWGIWGRQCPLDTVLTADSRVEAYRSLTVDPKLARRTRFAQQGARGAGLFAQQRKNAKPGY